MKRFFLFMIVLASSFLVTGKVFAYSTSKVEEYLPGGDNYFYVENYVFDSSNYLNNIYPIKVVPNSRYSLIIVDQNNPNARITDRIHDDGFSSINVEIKTSNDDLSIELNNAFDNYSGGLAYATFTITSDFISSIKMPFPISYGKDKETLKKMVFLVEGDYDWFEAERVGEFIPNPNIKDNDSPSISGDSVYLVDYDNQVSLDEIKKSIKATDEVDGDLSSNIYVFSTQYNANNKPGDYLVVFKVSDHASNEATFNLTVRVVDITSPVISGESSIEFSYVDLKTEEEIKNLLTVSDNVDTNISIVIESSNYQMAVGNYQIVFKATDSSNNTTSFEMNIKVSDNVPPEFSTDSYIISKYEADELSLESIKNMIKAKLSENGDEISNINILYDEYSGNENKAGEYEIRLSYRKNNIMYEKAFKIKVIEQNDVSEDSDHSSSIKLISIISSTAFLVISSGIILFMVIRRKK